MKQFRNNVWERECVCVYERENVYLCVYQKENVEACEIRKNLCMYVCVWERESVYVNVRKNNIFTYACICGYVWESVCVHVSERLYIGGSVCERECVYLCESVCKRESETESVVVRENMCVIEIKSI